MSNIVIVVCKPTDLTGMMTPGCEPGGGSPVLAWTYGRLGVKPLCVPGLREI